MMKFRHRALNVLEVIQPIKYLFSYLSIPVGDTALSPLLERMYACNSHWHGSLNERGVDDLCGLQPQLVQWWRKWKRCFGSFTALSQWQKPLKQYVEHLIRWLTYILKMNSTSKTNVQYNTEVTRTLTCILAAWHRYRHLHEPQIGVPWTISLASWCLCPCGTTLRMGLPRKPLATGQDLPRGQMCLHGSTVYTVGGW